MDLDPGKASVISGMDLEMILVRLPESEPMSLVKQDVQYGLVDLTLIGKTKSNN